MSLGLSIGLAVNCIDVGKSIVCRLREFDKDGPDAPEPFKKISTTLPIITLGFERIRIELNDDQSVSNTPEVRSFLENALKDLEKLRDRLEQTLPQQGASRWTKYRKGLRSILRQDEITEIVRNIEHYMTVWQHIEKTLNRPQTTPSSGPFWIIPSSKNELFSGREDVLKEIETRFEESGDAQPCVALCGLGGIGKTQIALEYCHRKRKSDGKLSVFWINAASLSRFEESLRNVASACHLVQPQSSEAGITFILKQWLESHHDSPWLMVIDNVDDKNMFFYQKTRSGHSCMECIPKCKHGSLLFTTRSYEVAVDLADRVKPIEVPKMPREAGAAFVKRRLKVDSSDTEQDTTELLGVLDNIPLAITQALSLISKRRWTIRQYIDKYTTSDEYKMALLDHTFMDSTRESGTLESVLKTWILSFNTIKKENHKAADIMCLVSFLQNQSIPQALLKEKNEHELDVEDAIECLIGFSFLEREMPETYRMHHMVQMATKLWLKEQGSLEVNKWASKALEAVSREFPDMRSVNGPTYSRDCQILMPHVDTILATSASYQPETKFRLLDKAQLLRNSGRYVFSAGYQDEAIQRFQESFDIYRIHLGEKHVESMDSAGALGWALDLEGKREAALPILEQVFKTRTEVLGEDDPRTIDCLSDFATALAGIDLEKSESLQRDAYQRSLRVLGPKHEDTLNCMVRLADVIEDNGNLTEAEQLQREAVNLMKHVLGTDHPITLISESDLLRLQDVDGNGDDLVQLYETLLAKKERLFGSDHRETLVTVWNYAIFLRKEDKSSEALRVCESTLQSARGGLRKNVSQSQRFIEQISALRDDLQQQQLADMVDSKLASLDDGLE